MLKHHPLGDPLPGIRAIGLENPYSQYEVVVIWGMKGKQHVFAFGAGDNVNHATWRALVEHQRTGELACRIAAYDQSDNAEPISDLYERRIRYFSQEEGFSNFLERLSREPIGRPNGLKIVFDSVVSGPWDRYATVRRTVFNPPSRAYLSNREDYFFR